MLGPAKENCKSQTKSFKAKIATVPGSNFTKKQRRKKFRLLWLSVADPGQGPGPPYIYTKKRTGTGCCFAFSFVVVVLFHMFYTLYLNSFCIQHKSLKNCLPAHNNKISKTVKKALSYLVTCTSVAPQTHRKTNIMVPFPKCIQAFLLIAINL